MKKYIAFMATAALMLAACAKEEAQPTVGGETETITVVLGADTKAALAGINASWEKGDKVSVYLGNEDLGDLECTDASAGTFTGELTSAGKDGKVVLNYPADATAVPTTQTAAAGSFDKDGLILKGETTLADLRAGEGASLANQAALLKFSVAQAGDVTFEVGTTKYTVTGCQTGKTYYACIAPVTAKLTARIGGYLSKATSANKTFAANKVYDLTNLPAPQKGTWGIRGSFVNGSWSQETYMYKDINNSQVVKNVDFGTGAAFKFYNSTNGWSGYQENNWADKAKGWMYISGGGGNDIPANGKVDIYVNESGWAYKIVTAGTNPF